ncbi:UBN2_2 domain-containing protein, partial [Cephalotus follicularis]
QHEKMETLSAILLHLQEMYGAKSRTQRFNLSRRLFKAQMPEGASVHEHGLKMIDMIEQLAQLGFFMDHDLYVDLILASLPKSFSQFLVNFHMNEIEVTLSELIAMMRTAEADFDSGKSKTHSLLLPSSRSAQGKGVLMPVNTKGKGKNKNKKKKGKIGASMFMIELNLALNSSSSWVLDTGCGANLCNSLQGLRKVRKLGAGDLDLRLGDGYRIIVEAVGVYDVILNDGYVLRLYPCYFI